MVQIGQKVRFDPFDTINGFLGSNEIKGEYVTGTVVAVYDQHKWFSVEWGDPKQRTSFNFADIGKAVKIIG